MTGFGLARPSRVPKARYTSADFVAREQRAHVAAGVAGRVQRGSRGVGRRLVRAPRGPDVGDHRARRRRRAARVPERVPPPRQPPLRGRGRRAHASCSARSTTGRGTSRAGCARCRRARRSARCATTTSRSCPVHVDTWGPLVFVNLDPDAVEPLAEYLEGVPADTAWAGLDEFRCQVTARIPVPCNWKVVAEGFSESYHVQGIHPEMLASVDDVNSPQRIFGQHSVLYQDYGVPSPRLGPDVADAKVWESFVRTQGDRVGIDRDRGRRPTARGRRRRDDARRDRRRASATTSRRSASTSRSSTPSSCCGSRSTTCSRIRACWCGVTSSTCCSRSPVALPTPRSCVVFVLHRVPSPDKPRRRPRDHVFPPDGDIGPVFNQDISVLKTAQRGPRATRAHARHAVERGVPHRQPAPQPSSTTSTSRRRSSRRSRAELGSVASEGRTRGA